MSPTLRRAGPADAEAIARLTAEAYSPWIALIGREPLPMAVNYAEALRRDRFDVLEDDGVLIALLQTELKSDHLLIVSVAVHPDAQGRGFGRRLLAEAEAIAREARVVQVKLFTNRRFERNVAIYKRCGFVVEREENPFPGTIAVHMAKAI